MNTPEQRLLLVLYGESGGACVLHASGYGDGAIKLTDDEIPELFSTGYALFDEKDGRILEIEESCGEGKLLISAPGIDIRDVVIESGNAVTYYAEFKHGENTVYI